MRLFLTGGTGLIGRRLAAELIARGDEVRALVRSPAKARALLPAAAVLVEGDVAIAGEWQTALAGCDAAINLAGEPIVGRRWNEGFKARMRTSRVDGSANVAKAVVAHDVRALINASAVGYYGDTTAPVDEASPAGDDFLARLCVDWEAAARGAATANGGATASGGATANGAATGNRRVVLARIGIVLDPDGGALAKMIPAFRAFAGGPIGSGKQWVSWIHHEDAAGIIRRAIDDARCEGPIDVTAPSPVTMRDFAAAVGRALHRPSWLPAPAFALRALFGEGATPLTMGQRVLPTKALALGHAFRFPSLDAALADVLAKKE
jgi:uncharacterized protein